MSYCLGHLADPSDRIPARDVYVCNLDICIYINKIENNKCSQCTGPGRCVYIRSTVGKSTTWGPDPLSCLIRSEVASQKVNASFPPLTDSERPYSGTIPHLLTESEAVCVFMYVKKSSKVRVRMLEDDVWFIQGSCWRVPEKSRGRSFRWMPGLLGQAGCGRRGTFECRGCECLITWHAKKDLPAFPRSALKQAPAPSKCILASSSQAGPSASARSKPGSKELLSGRMSLGAVGGSLERAGGEVDQQEEGSAETPLEPLQTAEKRKASELESCEDEPAVLRSSPRLAAKGTQSIAAPEQKKAKMVIDLKGEFAKTVKATPAKDDVGPSPQDDNLHRLQQAFPPEKYGAFQMVKIKDDWRVHCVACNADLAPGAEREKLGNVKKHIEGQQKKKDAVSKHMQNVATHAERVAARDEKAVKERESMLQRRKGILALYREEGKQSISYM
jgi:hypothetical protein